MLFYQVRALSLSSPTSSLVFGLFMLCVLVCWNEILLFFCCCWLVGCCFTILRLSSCIMHVYTLCVQYMSWSHCRATLHMFHAHSVQFLFADRQIKTRIWEKKPYASHTDGDYRNRAQAQAQAQQGTGTDTECRMQRRTLKSTNWSFVSLISCNVKWISKRNCMHFYFHRWKTVLVVAIAEPRIHISQ